MRIVVGLSGGVDSSVAAWILKEAGHDVIGLFMRNWHDESVVIDNECPWIDDANDAMLVASHIGIPFQVLDLSEAYRERIVDYMFEEYEQGRTPNPDVLCNREIKFDLFLKAAVDLGAEAVATGHYCRKTTTIVDGVDTHQLKAGIDGNKDQSYFLCQLNQTQLENALFPIGEMTKPEVRELASRIELPTADKKDSQGLCFIGKVRLPEFLQQQLKVKAGDIVEIPANHSKCLARAQYTSNQSTSPINWNREDGTVVGEHQGAHFFTVGQRRGLNVGGKPEPLFVLAKDVVENVLYVGQGESHPGLLRNALRMHRDEVHWIREDLALDETNAAQKFEVRIRYRQPLQHATLALSGDYVSITFDNAQSGIAAGQFAAWYDGDECIGSGVICD
ncbi:MAG: tRNA 2-thiouridine(34) synthase MnmA [Crocinitomicaceae bacterium]|jgi:tRNA-uridine 2-sulfurtransferase|nr:tRNA 2-thiouridine(34) synthase MnmA [Crocinitomicaceae bacterium]